MQYYLFNSSHDCYGENLMTFLLTVNKTNNGLFIYRTKEIFTVNIWFINLAIYKGDLTQRARSRPPL